MSKPEESIGKAVRDGAVEGLVEETRRWGLWAGWGAGIGAVVLGCAGFALFGWAGLAVGGLVGAVGGGFAAWVFYLWVGSLL